MRLRSLAMGLAVVLAATAACGNDDGGDGDRLSGGDDYSVASALGEIPASLGPEESWMLVTGDVGLASEFAGLARPEEPDDVADWVFEVTGGNRRDPEADPPVFVPVGSLVGAGDPPGTDVEAVHDELGWSLADVDAFAAIETPPMQFSVVVGDLDEGSLGDGLVDVADGVVSTSDRDDHTQDHDGSSLDRLGRPVRLAERDGRIAIGFDTPTVAEWAAGVDDTLAADEQVRAVAEQLDDQGVYAAVIVRQRGGFGLGSAAPVPPEVAAALAEHLPTEPFETVGMGWGVEDGEPVVIVVIGHADRDAAEENELAFADLLASGDTLQGRPVSEIFEGESVRSTGPGLVELRLRPGPEWYAGAAFRMLTVQDVPFVHA